MRESNEDVREGERWLTLRSNKSFLSVGEKYFTVLLLCWLENEVLAGYCYC